MLQRRGNKRGSETSSSTLGVPGETLQLVPLLNLRATLPSRVSAAVAAALERV